MASSHSRCPGALSLRDRWISPVLAGATPPLRPQPRLVLVRGKTPLLGFGATQHHRARARRHVFPSTQARAGGAVPAQDKRDGIFHPIPFFPLPAAAKETMSQNIPRDARSEQGYLPAGTGPQASGQDLPHLMLVISFLMESETVREWPASTDHCGGSLGLTARERAVWMRPAELSSMVLAEETMGSMALRPCTGRQWAGEARDCAREVTPSPATLIPEQPLEAQGLLPPPHYTPSRHQPHTGTPSQAKGEAQLLPTLQQTLSQPGHILPAPAASHLWADLGRNGGKLRVGGEGCQVIHCLYERGGGGAAPLPVLLVELAVQGLVWRDQSSYPTPTMPQVPSPPWCPGRETAP